MLILAIDQSTTRRTTALLDNEAVRGSSCREQGRRGHTGVDAIVQLLRDSGAQSGEVDVFAVGLGPGSYAGLRVSLSICVGMALPGAKPIVGVSSAEALADDIQRETGQSRVTVVGDARRQRLWMGRFEADTDGPKQTIDFRLLPIEEAGSILQDSGVIVTSDWESVGRLLQSLAPSGTTLIEEARLPRAEAVGQLVFRKTGGQPPGPGPTPSPIYLHPPVFVEPRFPDRADAHAQ